MGRVNCGHARPTNANMKYVRRNGEWVDPDTGVPMEITNTGVCMPSIQSDIPAYFSVASGRWIDGNRARRDDLARTGCRPAEPIAKKDRYCTSKKWAERLGLEHNNAPDAGRPKHWGKDFSSKRIETT